MSAQDKVNEVAGKHGKQNAATSMLAVIENQKTQIQRALPKGLDADRMIRIAWSTIKGNRKLLECSSVNILSCVMESAQLGLELDGLLGHAFLVPYKVKGILTAQLQLGYKGLIVLAHRSGIHACSASVVYSEDVFDYSEGTENFLKHKKALRGPRGEPICVWAACGSGVDRTFRVLTLDEIERAKKSSKTAGFQDSPWQSHWDAMAEKTAMRALLKRQPMSSEYARPMLVDEDREREAPLYTQSTDEPEAEAEVVEAQHVEEEKAQ